MPLPTLLCLAFATGIAAAVGGRSELRVSPRPAPLSRSFAAYILFVTLLIVPISLYFYVFHGDWFLLYTVDVRKVPSALALIALGLEVGLGAGGFLVGAGLVRSQRDLWATLLAGLVAMIAFLAPLLFRGRLRVVGSYAQFHRGYGLSPLGESAIRDGGLLMGALLAVGTIALLARLSFGARRGA